MAFSKDFFRQSSFLCRHRIRSVRNVGKQLKVVATAEDGVIEAIEMQDRDFVAGVQWHPERDYETNRPLFEN